MRITSGGNRPRLLKVSVSPSPEATCCTARLSPSATTRLPTTSSLILMASSTVMPERYIRPKVLVKRDMMIFCRIGPITGIRSLAWSHR